MRIALFTEVFLPKVDGIVTRLLRTLEELERNGHEALIFAPDKPPSRYGRHEVHKVSSWSFRPWYPEMKIGMPGLPAVQHLKRFRPDVVHAVNPVWLAGFGCIVADRMDLPLLASFHTDVAAYTKRLGLDWLHRPTLEITRHLHGMADLNLCTSGPMLDLITERGYPNPHLWPKAVDTRTYHPTAADPAMRERLTDGDPEAPLMLYAGRLSKEKDLDQLLPVIRRLNADRDRPVRLAFVGEGPHRGQLEKNFADTPTVFTGYLSGEELASAFASADVFAFPSTTETLGLVALESFASGVPVVGSRAGGIPFVIDEGVTGHLVDVGDHDTWVERLGGLIDDPERRRRMGDAARDEAEKHSWAKATDTLVDFYEQTIAAHTAAKVAPGNHR